VARGTLGNFNGYQTYRAARRTKISATTVNKLRCAHRLLAKPFGLASCRQRSGPLTDFDSGMFFLLAPIAPVPSVPSARVDG
jgi:hypothetical protein